MGNKQSWILTGTATAVQLATLNSNFNEIVLDFRKITTQKKNPVNVHLF